jgi:hypothetical protein
MMAQNWQAGKNRVTLPAKNVSFPEGIQSEQGKQKWSRVGAPRYTLAPA